MHNITKRITRLLTLIGVLLLVGGCRIYVPTKAPTPEFPAENLLIDASAFPPGWGVNSSFEIPGPVAGEAKEWERVARTFYGHTTGADQAVYRYRNNSESSEAFKRWLDRSFSSNEFISVWETPAELQFQSGCADQFHLACAHTTSNYVCQALGQYREYVVQLYVPMQPRTNVSYADLKHILQTMEEHIASYLKLELHAP
jgi:hypothetical protein